MDSRISFFFFPPGSYNSLLQLFIFMFKTSLIWPVLAPLIWLVFSLDMSPSFFECFLIFWFNKISRFTLYFPTQAVEWAMSLLLGVLIPFGGEWYLEIMIWIVGVSVAPGVSLLLVSLVLETLFWIFMFSGDFSVI